MCRRDRRGRRTRDTHERRQRVEEIRDEDCGHRRHELQAQRAHDVEFEEHGREIRRADDALGRRRVAKAPRHGRDSEDRSKEGERILSSHQRRGNQHARQQECGTMIERAESKERCGVRLDQASVPQSDQRQQETDSGSRSQSQPRGNGRRDLLAKRRGGHDEKQHTCPEDDAESCRPRYLLLQHDGECEERVEAHARRDGEWEPCVESHE